MKLIKYPVNVPLVRQSTGLSVRNHRNSVKLRTSSEDIIPPLKAGDEPSEEQQARSKKIQADFLITVSQVSPDVRDQYRLVKIPNGMTVKDLELLFNSLSLIGLRSRRRGNFYEQQSESVRRHLKSAKARISAANQKRKDLFTYSDDFLESKPLSDIRLKKYEDFLKEDPSRIEEFLEVLKSGYGSLDKLSEIDSKDDSVTTEDSDTP
jgi:pantothenate synthetase